MTPVVQTTSAWSSMHAHVHAHAPTAAARRQPTQTGPTHTAVLSCGPLVSCLCCRYMAAQARAKSLLAAYKSAPRSSRSSCASEHTGTCVVSVLVHGYSVGSMPPLHCMHAGSKRGNALCASLSDADEDSFTLMNSPAVFSWTNMPASGVSSNPFGPVGDQKSCWACVRWAAICMVPATGCQRAHA